MKTQKRVFWIVAIGLAVLLPTVGAVHAAAISTPFTGTEGSCIPIASGTATALPGGNFHIRGMVLECLDEATDPRAAGSNTVVINGNWGPDMAGPAWGSFRLVSGEGGVWSGTWAGMLTAG